MSKELLWSDCPKLEQILEFGNKLYDPSLRVRICLECDRRAKTTADRFQLREDYLSALADARKIISESHFTGHEVRFAENIFGGEAKSKGPTRVFEDDEVLRRFEAMNPPDEFYDNLDITRSSQVDHEYSRRSAVCQYLEACRALTKLLYLPLADRPIYLPTGQFMSFNFIQIERRFRNDSFIEEVDAGLLAWESLWMLFPSPEKPLNSGRSELELPEQEIRRVELAKALKVENKVIGQWIKRGILPMPHKRANAHFFYRGPLEHKLSGYNRDLYRRFVEHFGPSS